MLFIFRRWDEGRSNPFTMTGLRLPTPKPNKPDPPYNGGLQTVRT